MSDPMTSDQATPCEESAHTTHGASQAPGPASYDLPLHTVARTRQVLRMLGRLGCTAHMFTDPPRLVVFRPTPFTTAELDAMWWGIAHLPAHGTPITVADLVGWQQKWQCGMRLVATVDLAGLPTAARTPFVSLLSAWTTSRAQWWLRRHSRVLFTRRVQVLLDRIAPQTPDEEQLLAERRRLWQDHFDRYCQRHKRWAALLAERAAQREQTTPSAQETFYGKGIPK